MRFLEPDAISDGNCKDREPYRRETSICGVLFIANRGSLSQN